MKHGLLGCLAVLAVLVLCLRAPLARAQSTDAAVTGRVVDPTNAVIVGATVTVINTDTQVTRKTITNAEGLYFVPNVPPGNYRVEAAKGGFKTVIKPDVVLHVQDVAAINFKMILGSVAESVTVQGGAPMVNTTDATVSTTIDRHFAENLPLNGRSFQTLLLLTPGTTFTPALDNSNNGGTFSVNGQRTNANNFTTDGVSSNLGAFGYSSSPQLLNGANPSLTVLGSTQGMVSVDGLQEFRIQTSTYAPEFGRQPGGQVSLLTRAGTNAFHGTGFDYLRNDALDASNWFNGYQQNPPLPKGKERQNDFGGTLGGPILKDKTFLFFSYEGLRLLLPQTQIEPVPPLALRHEAAPQFQPILNSFPLPDPNGDGATFTQSQSFPTNLDSYSLRLDHNWGANKHIFGRYSHTSSNQTVPGGPGLAINTLLSRGLTLGADMSLTSGIMNEARVNYAVSVSTTKSGQDLIGGAKQF